MCASLQVEKIPHLDIHKVAVTNILMACQNYMRHKIVQYLMTNHILSMFYSSG